MKHRNFSHIYIEEGAFEYEVTKTVLERFEKASVIPISSYKDVFNRPQQEWQTQKQSQKLILAVKPDDLLYKASDIAPDFGHEHFYYNTPLLNCVYDCSYCFLQGLYPSANLVFFVNQEDFFSAVDEKLAQLHSLYLCISYETDLLGFESLFGINKAWIEFARSRPELTIESRTKSANFAAIADIEPLENFIFAWTLSPAAVQSRFESRTPELRRRIEALQQALSAGWPVRICIDPVLHVDGWEEQYSSFVQELATEVPLESIQDFSIGVFRMNSGFLKQIRKQQRPSELLYYPYTVQDGLAGYDPDLENNLKELVHNEIVRAGVAPEKIVIV